MGKFRDTIKWEKSQMTPFRFKLNYRILPALLILFVACLGTGAILMSIDEHKYVVPFLCLCAVGALPILLLPAFIPLIRKREAKTECTRYDFDERTEAQESYLFENAITLNVFETEIPPFTESIGSITGMGVQALNEALVPILGERYQTIATEAPAIVHQKFIVNDFSDGVERIPFEITQEVQPNGKLRVSVTEKNSLRFDRDGVTLNGTTYPYSEVSACVRTSNFLMRVSVDLQLTVREDLLAFFFLDSRILQIIRQFDLNIENRDILDYIVNHKEEAFRKILKRGTIKKIK